MSKTVSIFIAVIAQGIFSKYFKDSYDFATTCMIGIIGLKLSVSLENNQKSPSSNVWWLDLWALFLLFAEIKVFVLLMMIKTFTGLALSTILPIESIEFILSLLTFCCFLITCIKSYKIERQTLSSRRRSSECHCSFRRLSQIRQAKFQEKPED